MRIVLWAVAVVSATLSHEQHLSDPAIRVQKFLETEAEEKQTARRHNTYTFGFHFYL